MNRITTCAILVTCSLNAAYSAESSTEAGYSDGFIVGQARHNNKEAGLDASRIELLSRINSESHAEGGQGRSAADYKAGWKKGYADGFAGKARGGVAREPLPVLPIKINRTPLHSYKSMGKVEDVTPLEQLAKLAKESTDKDLFIVDAQESSTGTTDNLRLIFDRKEKIFLKLRRSKIEGVEESYDWVLMIDFPETSLTEEKLWSSDGEHRKISSKFGEAKASVPVQYEKNPKYTDWP